MQKDIEHNELYDVSISDWISILQDKKTTHANLFIFLASTVIGSIVIVSQYLRDFSNSYVVTGFLLLMIFFLYLLYRLVSEWFKRKNKPIIELYNKIILGELTDPKKIRDEYKKIKDDIEGF
jgi:thiosulfate reductase cytochrome b subunit